MLELKGLSKTFVGRRAVRSVDLILQQGEVLGFLGPNGAGKSTTMRMIAGVLEPDSGDALIGGRSIVLERRAAQAKLGYLPEGAPAHGDTTARAFLDFVADARGLRGEARRTAIDRAIADARITSVFDRRIGDLSKGYKRRVGLAAAILHDPPVLVLDEPTDGLDPNQKRAVRALIARMAPQKSILISTHTLEEVTAMCTRSVIIDRGRVVADMRPDELEARGGDGGLERAFFDLTDQTEADAS